MGGGQGVFKGKRAGGGGASSISRWYFREDPWILHGKFCGHSQKFTQKVDQNGLGLIGD